MVYVHLYVNSVCLCLTVCKARTNCSRLYWKFCSRISVHTHLYSAWSQGRMIYGKKSLSRLWPCAERWGSCRWLVSYREVAITAVSERWIKAATSAFWGCSIFSLATKGNKCLNLGSKKIQVLVIIQWESFERLMGLCLASSIWVNREKLFPACFVILPSECRHPPIWVQHMREKTSLQFLHAESQAASAQCKHQKVHFQPGLGTQI